MAERRDQVWQRAQERCEYCQLPQQCTVLPHEVDHIRSQKHHGLTTPSNLCLACAHCNLNAMFVRYNIVDTSDTRAAFARTEDYLRKQNRQTIEQPKER